MDSEKKQETTKKTPEVVHVTESDPRGLLIFGYVCSFIGAMAIIIVILICGFLTIPRLFGLTPYAVATGSMEPTIKTGSLVFVQPVDGETISSGDVITFKRPIGNVIATDGRQAVKSDVAIDEGKILVTHRVVQNDKDNRRVYTKGDANVTNDIYPVTYRSVLGKVVFIAPDVGWLLNLVDDWEGKTFLVLLVIGSLGLCLVGDSILRKV